MKKGPPVPPAREATVRRQIEALLRGEPQSAREISAAVGIPEKEVGAHLEHLRQSLRGSGRLRVHPAACKSCGFLFSKRERLNRPGRCPACRSQSIAVPRFIIVQEGAEE
jgi:predicted Zn-ribbon and HTH transcriptional regulator